MTNATNVHKSQIRIDFFDTTKTNQPLSTANLKGMTSMKTKTILAATLAAASMSAVFQANAETFTTNGVTWTYVVNSAKNKTVTLGGLDNLNQNVTPNDTQRAMPAATELDASLIPWKFTDNGTNYTVSALGSQAFRGCTNLTGNLSFPSTVKTLGRACLYQTKVRIITFGGVTRIYGYGFQQMSAQPIPDLSDVTTIEGGAFYGSPFTGVARLAKSATCAGWRSFCSSKSLEAILALGPDTVTSGTQSTTTFAPNSFAAAATNVKVIFMGPNTRGGNGMARADKDWAPCLNGVTNCKMFVPNDASWHGDAMSTEGTSNEIIYYGSSTNLDFIVDDDAKVVVARPVTEDALVTALDAAPLFRTHFGWDMKVDTTNAIAVTAGTITAAKFKDAGIKANSLMLNFAVKNQAQLDSILNAVPVDAMVGIDPTGLTENMVVEDRENVFVKNVPGVTVRRRANGGFAILVL